VRVTKSFIIFTPCQILLRWENQENETDGSYGTHERNAYYKFGLEDLKERDKFKNANVNGKILILILIKYSDRLCNGFMWFGLWTSGGYLRAR
jgi:hypothetical protein